MSEQLLPRRGLLPGARDDLQRAIREAVTLPFLFLTVVALTSLRVSATTGALRFPPPALVFLLLALLVLAVLVQSGTLAPASLVSAQRRPLENASGVVVLVTLFAATAQLLDALAPPSGLFHAVFVVFFAVLFWNTLAMRPDARRALRSLLLVFCTALVVQHVVLAALYEPQASLAKRVLTALLEGASLGAVAHEPSAPVTGYVVFGALVLYFVGIVLLPRAAPLEPEALPAQALERHRAQ